MPNVTLQRSKAGIFTSANNNTMNLIQQFPDVSKKMRDKMRLSKKDYSAIEDRPYYQSNVLAKYYDSEFRKWHFKMLLILITLFGSAYLIVMHSSQIFNWIMSR